MYTCRETIELLTTAEIRSLTLKERVGVRVHVLMCKLCNAYYRQVQLIKTALRKSEISEAEAQHAVERISKTLESDSEYLR
jgi:hypothetical protein